MRLGHSSKALTTMNPISLNAIKPEAYQSWLQLDSTQRLLALESSWLGAWVRQLHGHHLAYTGIDSTPKFLRFSRTRHNFKLGFPWSQGIASNNALCKDDEWPLADESLDVIILQHSLDFSRNPHQLLREASRALVPGGYLLIINFNPISWWGGWRWLNSFSSKLPWITRPISSGRLIDWLTLLDMQVEQSFKCAHLWPASVGSEKINRQIDRVLAGNNWLPSNAYLIVARKTIAGFTPIRQLKSRPVKVNYGLPVAIASAMLPTLKSEQKK